MGYQHITNLYKAQTILLFKECYALEKIHGTSAHVSLKNGQLHLSPGGVKLAAFEGLFDVAALQATMAAVADDVTIFGEAYGGSCQRMAATYGPNLRFVAFEVRIGDSWLEVPNAEGVTIKCGLEFVDYTRVPTDLAAIDAERDKDSTQAIRNGMGPGKMREGVVLRPPIEVNLKNGERVVAKHKRDDFGETATPRPVVDPARLQVLSDAAAIANEWVTPMRLTHVLDKLGNPDNIESTGKVIHAMLEDVLREAAGEIVEGSDVTKAINSRTAQLYKGKLKAILL